MKPVIYKDTVQEWLADRQLTYQEYIHKYADVFPYVFAKIPKTLDDVLEAKRMELVHQHLGSRADYLLNRILEEHYAEERTMEG